MTKQRSAGLSPATERSHLRRLENAVRDFVAYYEDHKQHHFAPRTRELAEQAQTIFVDLDALRAAARGTPRRKSTQARKGKAA